MNCEYCSDVIVLEPDPRKPAELWIYGSDDRPYHTRCLELARMTEAEGEVRLAGLDPFMGSGTVGLVARKLGRSYLGIELKPEYCDMARRRIKAETALPLFED